MGVNQELHQSFKDKKVFITGHTGFKGTWLSVWLEKLGAEIKGYALEPVKRSIYPLVEKELSIYSEINDIRNAPLLEKSILDFQPDFIFHLAAQPLVLYSYAHPIETFEVNVIGTGNVLNSARKLNKKCAVVVVTTDKIYKNNEWEYPYREIDPLGGHDPYSASKAATEIITDSFRSSFFSNSLTGNMDVLIASARAGNVIGGGDFSENRLVPDIVSALQSGEKIQLRNPNSIRPWQHVIEPLWGYLLLAQSLYKGIRSNACPWNFGPKVEDCGTVKSFTENAIHYWGSGEFEEIQNLNAPHEAQLLMLDSTKAITLLKWNSRMTISERIEKTINWYKRYLIEAANPYFLINEDVNDLVNKKEILA